MIGLIALIWERWLIIAVQLECLVKCIKVLCLWHCYFEQDIIHRDLKPANIIRKKSGQCIIVDFGLSKDTKTTLGTVSHDGDFKGTPAYSAPEVQLGPKSVEKATDVFALGVIFYEVIIIV